MNNNFSTFLPPLCLSGRIGGRLGGFGLILCSLLVGCSQKEASVPQVDGSTVDSASGSDAGTGSLTLTANGEDFVRQGFVTKDGWAIAFDHVYVTVPEATAYQTDPPYDPKSSETLDSSTAKVSLPLIETSTTIDLAEGDANAEPISVTTKSAPAGHYNTLAWVVAPDKAADNEYSIQLLGTATKGDRAIQFDLGFDPTYRYTCGEFVGDSRKGFVDPNQAADLEITLHFDHIFGDGDAPAEDEINTNALGFEPLAAIATDGSLTTDLKTLSTTLAPDDKALLEKAIAGLGHVGEGHCAFAPS